MVKCAIRTPKRCYKCIINFFIDLNVIARISFLSFRGFTCVVN